MSKEKYNPPYTVSEEAVNLIADKTKGDAQKKNAGVKVGVNVGVKLSAREGSDKSGVWVVKAL